MSNSVPVASNLLESKFMGFSVRRLVESMAIPLAPCAILHTIGFPLLITFPLFLGGIAIGGTVFLKTPSGQRPLSWTMAMLRHKTSTNVYTWQHPGAVHPDRSTNTTRDDWITRDVPPHVSPLEEATAAVEHELMPLSAGGVPIAETTAGLTADKEGESDVQ